MKAVASASKSRLNYPSPGPLAGPARHRRRRAEGVWDKHRKGEALDDRPPSDDRDHLATVQTAAGGRWPVAAYRRGIWRHQEAAVGRPQKPAPRQLAATRLQAGS